MELVQLTGEAIDWLDAHEQIYDVWFPVAYAATSCALVQVDFHGSSSLSYDLFLIFLNFPHSLVPYMGETYGF